MRGICLLPHGSGVFLAWGLRKVPSSVVVYHSIPLLPQSAGLAATSKHHTTPAAPAPSTRAPPSTSQKSPVPNVDVSPRSHHSIQRT